MKTIPDRSKLDASYQTQDVLLAQVRIKFGELPTEGYKNPTPAEKRWWNSCCDELASEMVDGSKSEEAVLNYKFN